MSKTKSKNRKSPLESATAYKIGTVKRGVDGNLWIVRETQNGIKRWVVHNDVSKYIQVKRDVITMFDCAYVFDKLKIKPKLLESLNISSGVLGVGELLYKTYKVKRGIYQIYYCGDSLAAIHIDDDIFNQIFHLVPDPILVDAGMFAYHNHQLVIPDRITKKYITYSDDAFVRCLDRSRNNSKFLYVTKSDMIPEIDDNTIVSVFASNQIGDGRYKLYRSKNSFYIMGGNTEDKILDMIDI